MTAPLSQTNPAGTEDVGGQPGIPAHQQQQGALDQPMGTEVTGKNHDPEPATSVQGGRTPQEEIDRLRAHLVSIGRPPVVQPEGEESPVDTVIRLLGTKPPLLNFCDESYCNKEAGHRGEHGIISR
jgi:hypothetical protein